MDFQRDCTQHKDFSETVYQRLKEKYANFKLPHTWSNPYYRDKQTNRAYLLRSGLETPTTQQSTPQLFSPNWGKMKLINSLTYRPPSLRSSPWSGSSNSTNVMLSTQFNCNYKNSDSASRSIPLFSNHDISEISSSYKSDIENNTSSTPEQDVNDHLLFQDLFQSQQPIIQTSPKTPIQKATTSLNDALSNSVLGNRGYSVGNVHTNRASKRLTVSSVAEAAKRSSGFNSSYIQDPFIDYTLMDEHDQQIISDNILSSTDVAIALVYSDKTSHLGLGVVRSSLEKVTVSGLCLVFYTKSQIRSEAVFLPICSSGENSSPILELLYQLFNSNIMKITFNAYQLFIVVSILTRSYKKDSDIRNILDLKIASWLLTSDDVPQTLNEIKLKYMVESDSASTNNFSEMLYQALVDLLNVKLHINSELEKEKLLNLFNYLECPLLGTICQMGQTGISIDNKKMQSLNYYLTERLQSTEKEASSILGRPILMTSPVQLRQILYDELKLDQQIPDKLTRTATTREKSTSEACLLKMINVHPLPKLILLHRRLIKIKSTYIDGMPQYMKFGKLYPSWDQTSAATGRLAAFNPNIQAFPKGSIETENPTDGDADELSVRDIVIPAPGCKFVAVDFCSIELRILAHFTKDKELIDMFKNSDDIFTALTASWRNMSADDVTSSDRTKTKRVCYAIIYGVGIPKLSQILDISFHEAKLLMNSFLNKFQNIQKFTNAVINRARQTKKLRTILNRLRHFPEINCKNFAQRKSIERQAVNFVIQGSAADICKVSMLKLSEFLKKNLQVNAKLLIQIHDELLYEVYEANVTEFTDTIYNILESPMFTNEIHLSVPLKVKVQVGESWGKMVDL